MRSNATILADPAMPARAAVWPDPSGDSAMLCLYPATGRFRGTPVAYEMLGGLASDSMSTEDVVGLVRPLDRQQVLHALAQACLGAPFIAFIARVALPTGERVVRYVAHAGAGSDTTPIYAGVLIDETFQRQQAMEIERLQTLVRLLSRTSAEGETARRITHEIRHPLTALSLGVGAAARWLDQTPPDLGEAALAMQQLQCDIERASGMLHRVTG